MLQVNVGHQLGQAAQNQRAYENAPRSSESVIEAVISKGLGQVSTLESLVARLQSLRDRAFGSEPEVQSAAPGAPPQPCGAVYVLGGVSDHFDVLLNQVTGLVAEIERLV